MKYISKYDGIQPLFPLYLPPFLLYNVLSPPSPPPLLPSSPPHLSPLTSMPYAQSHYPFENKKAFEAAFPADFIAEGIDQTRGW